MVPKRKRVIEEELPEELQSTADSHFPKRVIEHLFPKAEDTYHRKMENRIPMNQQMLEFRNTRIFGEMVKARYRRYPYEDLQGGWSEKGLWVRMGNTLCMGLDEILTVVNSTYELFIDDQNLTSIWNAELRELMIQVFWPLDKGPYNVNLGPYKNSNKRQCMAVVEPSSSGVSTLEVALNPMPESLPHIPNHYPSRSYDYDYRDSRTLPHIPDHYPSKSYDDDYLDPRIIKGIEHIQCSLPDLDEEERARTENEIFHNIPMLSAFIYSKPEQQTRFFKRHALFLKNNHSSNTRATRHQSNWVSTDDVVKEDDGDEDVVQETQYESTQIVPSE